MSKLKSQRVGQWGCKHEQERGEMEVGLEMAKSKVKEKVELKAASEMLRNTNIFSLGLINF